MKRRRTSESGTEIDVCFMKEVEETAGPDLTGLHVCVVRSTYLVNEAVLRTTKYAICFMLALRAGLPDRFERHHIAHDMRSSR